MCGRFYIAADDPDEMISAYIAEAQARADSLGVPLTTSGEIRPTNIVPVVAPSALGRKPSAYPMKWGFTHPTQGMLVFNTRSESADTKPLFVTSIEDRRCLVPATCYYEWQKVGNKKVKYAIAPTDQPLYLAGLYFRNSREKLPCFSILTMDAADSIKSIHNRMPVIIPQARRDDWLSANCPYAEALKFAITDMEYRTA